MTHPHSSAAASSAYAAPAPPHQRPAESLAAAAELPKEARELAAPGMGAREYVDRLAGAGRLEDALAIVAHAMPRREAVWWAWATARRALAEPVEPAIVASLAATERWIGQPTDEHRRAAMAAAEAADIGTPAGCAGMAAFVSGGSLAPAGLPDAHPTEFLTAKLVNASLLLAASTGDPALAPERYAQSLQQGLDVMARLTLWPAAPAPGA